MPNYIKVMQLPILLLTLLSMLSVKSSAQDALTAQEVMMKSHLAYYYSGNDGVSNVKMSIINKRGKERVREFVMLRLDKEEAGKQFYYIYFKTPSDVSRMTFMVHKDPSENDARWIYIPSIDLIKPISADDKNSSFVNSDFSYEDISGRHPDEDNHSFAESNETDSMSFVIESSSKEKYKGFARKVSYIDRNSFLPLRELYYNRKGVLIKEFTAEEIEEIDGIKTITVRKMTNHKKSSHTLVTMSSIKYNIGLTEEIFTERYLKNPPRKFMK